MYYISYDPKKFKEILKDNNLTIQKLTNPDSDYYCGIVSRTISRSNKCGLMTNNTYNAIMNKVDISKCVISIYHGSGMTAFSSLLDTIDHSNANEDDSDHYITDLYCPLMQNTCIGKDCALAVKLDSATVGVYDVIYRCGLVNNYGEPNIIESYPRRK